MSAFYCRLSCLASSRALAHSLTLCLLSFCKFVFPRCCSSGLPSYLANTIPGSGCGGGGSYRNNTHTQVTFSFPSRPLIFPLGLHCPFLVSEFFYFLTFKYIKIVRSSLPRLEYYRFKWLD